MNKIEILAALLGAVVVWIFVFSIEAITAWGATLWMQWTGPTFWPW